MFPRFKGYVKKIVPTVVYYSKGTFCIYTHHLIVIYICLGTLSCYNFYIFHCLVCTGEACLPPPPPPCPCGPPLPPFSCAPARPPPPCHTRARAFPRRAMRAWALSARARAHIPSPPRARAPFSARVGASFKKNTPNPQHWAQPHVHLPLGTHRTHTRTRLHCLGLPLFTFFYPRIGIRPPMKKIVSLLCFILFLYFRHSVSCLFSACTPFAF